MGNATQKQIIQFFTEYTFFPFRFQAIRRVSLYLASIGIMLRELLLLHFIQRLDRQKEFPIKTVRFERRTRSLRFFNYIKQISVVESQSPV